MKKYITETSNNILYDLDGVSLENVGKYFHGYSSSIPEGINFLLGVIPNYESTELVIMYERHETDKEYKQRIKREEREKEQNRLSAEKKRERDLKQLAKLKKKYET
jgi:hypothetical protein